MLVLLQRGGTAPTAEWLDDRAEADRLGLPPTWLTAEGTRK